MSASVVQLYLEVSDADDALASLQEQACYNPLPGIKPLGWSISNASEQHSRGTVSCPSRGVSLLRCYVVVFSRSRQMAEQDTAIYPRPSCFIIPVI
jgi:hypothetical protein